MTATAIGQTLPSANTCASINDRLTTGHSRRALIGGVGLATLTGISLSVGCVAPRPAAATASIAPTAWDRVLKVYLKAKRASDRANAGYDRVVKKWDATYPDRSWIDLDAFPGNMADSYILYGLDLDSHELALTGRASTTRHIKAIGQVRHWRSLRRDNDKHHRIGEWEELVSQLDDRLAEAERALIAEPAPDVSGLAWKVRILFSGDEETLPEWSRKFVQPIFDDVERLAREGR